MLIVGGASAAKMIEKVLAASPKVRRVLGSGAPMQGTVAMSTKEQAWNDFPICRFSKVSVYDLRLAQVTAHGVFLVLRQR
jgi:hypothetical protein